MLRQRFLVPLYILAIWCCIWAVKLKAADTFYIAPSGGSDSYNGLYPTFTSGTDGPWATFQHAVDRMVAGDTLLVENGTYTQGITISGDNPASVITIRAQNERQAKISTNGAFYGISIRNASNWEIDGLTVVSADNNSTGGVGYDNIDIRSSHDITMKRMLVAYNNRYQNTSLMFCQSPGANVVFEEWEMYAHHREAMQFYGAQLANPVIVRRCYINGKDPATGQYYGNIPGHPAGYRDNGGETGGVAWPGSAFVIYPSGGVRFINCITENNWLGVEGEAAYNYVGPTLTDQNKIWGCISIGDRTGFLLTDRSEIDPGNQDLYQPHANEFKNSVAINPAVAGFYIRGAKTTTLNQCSAIALTNAGAKGFAFDFGGNEVSSSSFTLTNSLAMNFATGYGYFATANTGTSTWSSTTGDYWEAYGNAAEQLTVTGVTTTNPLTSNPLFGTCLLYAPVASPMNTAGLGNVPVGATVKYKYNDDGTLSATPLWNFDAVTGVGNGVFQTCGAAYAGLNDVAGYGCFDVQNRVNFQANSCILPLGSPPGLKFTQTDTADAPTRGAFCSGLTVMADTTGRQASYGGTATSTSRGATIAGSASNKATLFIEVLIPTGTSWAAGQAYLNLKILQTASNSTITSIYACRLNSSNVNQATVGSATGLSIPIATGIVQIPITLAAQTASAGDKLELVVGVTNASASDEFLSWEPSQTFDTPYLLGGSGSSGSTRNFFFADQ